MIEIFNGMLSLERPSVKIDDCCCPICNTQPEIHRNSLAKPDSMFGVKCCQHVSVDGYANELATLEGLRLAILVLRLVEADLSQTA